jgi:cold shock protein
MATGSVKWYNSAKGFGFIRSDQSDQDIFVHISHVKRAGWHELDPGQIVEFDVSPDGRGRLSATNLKDGRMRGLS